MIAACLYAGLLLIGETTSLSTDDLDSYVEQIVKARKACGPTAAWYCLRRLGLKPELKKVWDQVENTRDGTSLQDLLELIHSYHISAKALVGNSRALEDFPIPTILIIDESHCIVFDGLEDGGQRARYFEPANGELRTVSRELIEGHWSGQMIVFERPKLSHQGFLTITALAAVALISFTATGRWLIFHKR